MTNIGFIGTGNMGVAIIKGITGSKLSNNSQITAFDTDIKKLETLSEFGVIPCESASNLVKKCKYIFLAIKPQVFEIVLEEISSVVTEETVLISIAAGITSEFIQRKTIPNAKVVLVMPNTPLLLGEGATALAKVKPITDSEFEFVKEIFSSCGEVAVISEDKMKEVIAINGSSPAFIYLFAKGFIDYANSVGIEEETSKKLFAKTLIGSAKMITESGSSIDELIKMVSSPGGTTLAGLEQFYTGKLTEVINSACESCTNRAYELSK